MNKEISNGIDSFSYCAVPAQFQPNKFFPTDTSAPLSELLELYSSSAGKPLEVSFRELVPWVYGGSRASHYLHSYPAKLLPQIAHFFLANEVLCPRDGVVLDPFSGSGTVALEAVLSGRDAYYCDVNPFARLLTKSKTTAIPPCDVDIAMKKVSKAYLSCSSDAYPDVVNLSYWYNEGTSSHLSKLKHAISAVPAEELRALLLVCFSSVARKLSRANPRFSVPVRLKVNGEPVDVIASAQEVWSCFEKTVEKAKRQISGLSEVHSLGETHLVSENVLNLGDGWPSTRKNYGEVDMVITSPPYAGAQKYVRATSLSLGWLDQVKSTQLKSIENQTLGREHLPKTETLKLKPTSIDEADKIIRSISESNQTRAAIASVFLREMKEAAENIMKALKGGGYAVVIMADNTICGRHFPTANFTAKLFEDAGGVKILEVRDKIVSRGLQTKRASTSSSISHETITVFKKA
ncbi:hypothetical protein [Leisingera sp. ANG-Vp]|uniref:hypothetical protein n=1 Tax=Leisingera sp. ANG-Vp TaxID=1577896 RepID=UPI000A41CD5C|nr:hypothetical protein [Leisingera sp. ANG-Vp]